MDMRVFGESTSIGYILRAILFNIVIVLSPFYPWGSAVAQNTAKVSLKIRVVHAHSASRVVDASLKDLVRDLKPLRFTSYRLKDEALFKLAVGSTARLQLPVGNWMTVTLSSRDKRGRLGITIAVKELNFRAMVKVGNKARVVVPGPAFEGGRLILVLERPPAPK